MNKHTQLKLSLNQTPSLTVFRAQPSPVVIHKPQPLPSSYLRLSLALRVARRDIADMHLNTLPSKDMEPPLKSSDSSLQTPITYSEPVPPPTQPLSVPVMSVQTKQNKLLRETELGSLRQQEVVQNLRKKVLTGSL